MSEEYPLIQGVIKHALSTNFKASVGDLIITNYKYPNYGILVINLNLIPIIKLSFMVIIKMVGYFHFNFLLLGIVSLLSAKKSSEKLEFSQKLMGMEIRILVDAEKNNDLENAIAAAFDEGKRLNMIFSDWE